MSEGDAPLRRKKLLAFLFFTVILAPLLSVAVVGGDCHKGIAHQLPDMKGVPGWDVTFSIPSDRLLRSVADYAVGSGQSEP